MSTSDPPKQRDEAVIIERERNTSLVERTDRNAEALARQAGDEADFESQARDLHLAINEDKRQIELSLAMLQNELERGMEKVDEVANKAQDTAEDVKRRVEYAKERLEGLRDWRGVVRRHPWKTVGVSLAIGFYLGSMLSD